MRLPDPPPAWLALLDAFAAHEEAVARLAPATVGNHRTYLRAFAACWTAQRPDTPVTDATTADLAAFLIEESRRGIAPRTRRAEVATLRRFFAWLVGALAAILSHTAGLRGQRGRQRHTIVAMLCWTGTRSGELRTLRRDALDLGAGRADVVGKGSRSRVVLLPTPLLSVLRRFLDEVRPTLPPSPLLLVNAHPFVTIPHDGFGQEALAREVELAGLGAGVPGRHCPHKWRHTYATGLVRAGVDIPRRPAAPRSREHRVDRRLHPISPSTICSAP